jgi:hypothetical protein
MMFKTIFNRGKRDLEDTAANPKHDNNERGYIAPEPQSHLDISGEKKGSDADFQHAPAYATVEELSAAIHNSDTSSEPTFETPDDWMRDHPDLRVSSELMHPDREGIKPAFARELMKANHPLVQQALDGFLHKHHVDKFESQLLELIYRVAFWMGPVPASKSHHHPHPGGLFTHSLGVAVMSLNMSVSKNLILESTPRNRDADYLAWQLVCFICGLMHDIGKLNTTGRILPLAVLPDDDAANRFKSMSSPVYSQPWEPMVEGFEAWAKRNKIASFYIDYEFTADGHHRDYVVRYVMRVIPRSLLAFIYNATPKVRQQFEDFIRNPESNATTPIFQVVRDSDHINVRDSIDPRRKPGVIEMTSLIHRRFREYAGQVNWNLPSSPFIYAHVQKSTADGIRYYGLPFFIATEASIQGFIEYLLSQPMLGVSISQNNISEIIFNCLLKTKTMSQLIEGLLPEKLPLEGYPDYIPASRAVLRFKAREGKAVITSVEGKAQDALMEMPVIPVYLDIPSSALFTAPTLAFRGTPASSDAAVIPVTVQGDKIAPSDPSLKHDPDFMKELEEGLSQKDKEMLEGFISNTPKAVMPSSKKRQKKKPAQKSLFPETFSDNPDVAKEDTRQEEQQTSVAANEDTSQHANDVGADASTQDEAIIPAPRPGEVKIAGYAETSPFDAWYQCYEHLVQDLDHPDLTKNFWATVWLYLFEHHMDLAKATLNDKQEPIIKYSKIPRSIRVQMSDVIKKDKSGKIALLSRFWQDEPLNPDDRVFENAVKTSRGRGALKMVEFYPCTQRLIADFMPPAPKEDAE